MQKNIISDRFLLRQIIDSDLENVFKGLSHPDVIKYYGVSFDTLEATKEQMNWFKKPEQSWWAICSKENTIFYGACGLNDLNSFTKKAELGIWLLPEYWKQGIMKEVIPTICNYGFQELGLIKIEAFVETENHNCIKALSQLQFIHEETSKDCEFKNGKWISVDTYSIKNNQNNQK